MLRHLRATNFAILSDVGIEFGPGLNVLTGETGAGKSLIVEAVNLLRGGRASANIPRAGAKEAVVEAVFEIPDDLLAGLNSQLSEGGLPQNDGELLVRRIISRGGRSRTYINGALTTATRLAQVGSLLVDLASQHQHQGLTDAKRHTALLDAFADTSGNAKTASVSMKTAFGRVREIRAELASIDSGGDLDQRLDFLRYQLEELDSADVKPGEDEELTLERQRLGSADKLARACSLAEEHLHGMDRSASDQLNIAMAEVEQVAELEPELARVLEVIGDARAHLDDAVEVLRALSFEEDPERLAHIDDRLALIARLKRKHAGDLTVVIARREQLEAQVTALENRDGVRDELEAELKKAIAKATKCAKVVTKSRCAAANRLTREVGKALDELGMEAADLEVSLAEAALSETGADRVEILLRANRGEKAKPLSKVASGGELSRIMLAIKLVLRRAEEVSCYVFDEVDSGIGGKAAEAVGKQIKGVASSRQVLCVTHLAPIAAFATQHYRVEKGEDDGRTETRVDRLTEDERPAEIARMLGGSRAKNRAVELARELLEAAR